jgi:prevent-host-death family protein
MAKSVPATEFCRNFGEYQRRAQREPIEVQSHGKTTGYFVSADDFERMQRILSEARKAYHPSELPPHLREAVRVARMDPKHNKLDRLLED